MGNDFKSSTLNGISWTLVNQVGSQLMALVVSVTLARLLMPQDFGTVGMITVFTGFAGILSSFGLGSSIVYKQNPTQVQLSTIFWFNCFIGLLFTGLFWLLSPAIASFYQKPILELLTKVISISFIINGLTSVQSNILVKDLKFKSLTIITLVATLVAATVAISLAIKGYGVWSIVVQGLVGSSLKSLILWVHSSWRPKFQFSFLSIKPMLNFGVSVTANGSLNYWARNYDNFMIAKFLGDDALGVYGRVYGLMLLPLRNISQVIGRVLFPSFSSIKKDKKRIKQVYLKMTRVIALITFPMMIGIWTVAKEFVVVVFGEQWLAMIPILKIMIVLGMVQSILTINGTIYNSQGRADLAFKVGLFLKAIIIAGISIGLFLDGLRGVAIGYTIASIINAIPSLYFAGRLIDLKVKEQIVNLKEIFLASILMGVGILILGELIQDSSYLTQLFIKSLLGIVLYVAIIHVLRVSAYLDLVKLFHEKFKRNKAAI